MKQKPLMSCLLSVLYYASLGPLIALIFAVPVVVILGGERMDSLLLILLFGLPFVYIVGFVPALLTGLAAALLEEQRGKPLLLGMIGAGLSYAAAYIAFEIVGFHGFGLNPAIVTLLGIAASQLLYWPTVKRAEAEPGNV